MIVLPIGYLKKLSTEGPTSVVARNKLPERSLKEFRKTAEKISEAPWNMDEAASYLNKWCSDNEVGTHPTPMALEWIVDKVKVLTVEEQRKPLPDEWRHYAPGAAAQMTIKRSCASNLPAPKRRRLRGKTKDHGDNDAAEQQESDVKGCEDTKEKSTGRMDVTEKMTGGRDDVVLPPGDEDVPKGPGVAPVRRYVPPRATQRVKGAPPRSGALQAATMQAGMFGCSKCRRRPTGCAKCNPGFVSSRPPRHAP